MMATTSGLEGGQIVQILHIMQIMQIMQIIQIIQIMQIMQIMQIKPGGSADDEWHIGRESKRASSSHSLLLNLRI